MQLSCFAAARHTASPGWAGPDNEINCSSSWAGGGAVENDTSQVRSAPLPQLHVPTSSAHLPSLLQVSDDEHLANSRRPLLQIAGFDVHTCPSRYDDCIEEAYRKQIIAAVFCQSVPSDIASTLAQLLLGRNREIKLVRISKRPWQEQDPGAYNLLLQAPLLPSVFVSTIMRLRAQV